MIYNLFMLYEFDIFRTADILNSSLNLESRWKGFRDLKSSMPHSVAIK